MEKIKNKQKFKVFYLSLENLNQILENKIYDEVPDPKKFIIGILYQPLIIKRSNFLFNKNVFYEKEEEKKKIHKKKFFKSFKISLENTSFLLNKKKNLTNKNKSIEEKKKKKFSLR